MGQNQSQRNRHVTQKQDEKGKTLNPPRHKSRPIGDQAPMQILILSIANLQHGGKMTKLEKN